MDKALSRILYVEDDPNLRDLAQIALEKLGGFTLKMCASGPEAIDQASDFEPDLLLLDVMMPGMDGVTTLKELRKLAGLEHTPAIFMTARLLPQEIEQLLHEGGVIEVIPKPFDPITLSENIKSLWAKYTS